MGLGNRVKGPVVDCMGRRSLETSASDRKKREQRVVCGWQMLEGL